MVRAFRVAFPVVRCYPLSPKGGYRLLCSTRVGDSYYWYLENRGKSTAGRIARALKMKKTLVVSGICGALLLFLLGFMKYPIMVSPIFYSQDSMESNSRVLFVAQLDTFDSKSLR